MSIKHIITFVVCAASPVVAQFEHQWSNNFYTTDHCNVAESYSRIGYAGEAGHKAAEGCVTIGNNQADDCYLVQQTPDGTNAYDCTGPKGPGLNGASLLSFSGYNASCDIYTDYHCTQGQFHVNFTLYGCYTSPKQKKKPGKPVKSFKCKYPGTT